MNIPWFPDAVLALLVDGAVFLWLAFKFQILTKNDKAKISKVPEVGRKLLDQSRLAERYRLSLAREQDQRDRADQLRREDFWRPGNTQRPADDVIFVPPDRHQ